MKFEVLKTANTEEVQNVMNLFNGCVDSGEILFKPFETRDAFEKFFLSREDGVETVCLTDGEGGCFASGCLNEEKTKGYITFVAVRKELRRQGLGSAAIKCLEEKLCALAGHELVCFEATFFNPMNFVWVIPHTKGHEHPNAPGVDVGGNGYLFLKNCGYRDYAYQNAYHLDLSNYQLTPDISSKKEKLQEKGIRISIYDPEKHTGLEEMLLSFNNELWHREIMDNVSRKDGNPVLIVDWNGRAMGFTGPLAIQENGRGYLAGVGVHSDCRGMGAGKVLFGELCARLRDMGAEYMTLFTGETNPARNIYEAQGFKIVRTWADMRKQSR